MRLLLLAILLGFPLLELVLLARLAESHGWWVLAWVVLAAMAGFALLKEARFALVARLGAELAAGQFSIAAVIDSARTVLAGLLLIFPGVISDFIALTLLLLPRRVPEPVHAHARAHGHVIDGQFRRER
ncbi:MAG: FxsA family protein [Betaproteobacteria bacterium]|nr:FxsA family protein [Betaproteobacteria bacterium]PWB60128.1 MAG: exlusion protein FxsA [Betaproteobacteria bacterium]